MDLLPALVDTDEEVLLLSLSTTSSKKQRIYRNQIKIKIPFILDRLTDDYCWIHFRFLKSDLIRLKTLLGIPDLLKCRKLVTVPGMEALCILLKRLIYPNR